MIEGSENKARVPVTAGCKHSAYGLRGGVLICSVCGAPSSSPKWRINIYGRSEAAKMNEAEESVRKMGEKEKTALMAPVIDPNDPTLLQWGAHKKLTYAQRHICFERGITKPEDSPENTLDAGVIREQVPNDLKRAAAEAKGKLSRAEGLLESTRELQSKFLQNRRKLGSVASELSFSRDVPPEMLDKYNKAQNKERVAEELVKEAERACEAPRAEYYEVAAALDRWVLLEQARRHLLARQGDEASRAPSGEVKSLEERIAEASGPE